MREKITCSVISVSKRIITLLKKNLVLLSLIMLFVLIFPNTVLAGTADTLWTTISGLVETWVTRLGGVVMFVGGIMFGLGWKNDDAEQKSRGVGTLISGAIVTAIAAITSTFFA